jgi:hypothetical protein
MPQLFLYCLCFNTFMVIFMLLSFKFYSKIESAECTCIAVLWNSMCVYLFSRDCFKIHYDMCCSFSLGRTLFNISSRAGLVVINFLSIYISLKYFFLHIQDSFVGFVIVAWDYLFFLHFVFLDIFLDFRVLLRNLLIFI